jgi:peroxiredoxin
MNQTTTNEKQTIDIGRIAPNFTLVDTTGTSHTLLQAAAERPIILVFYRGDWCPWCQIQMKQLAGVYQELQERGVALWAISPQTQEKNSAFKAKREIPFPILDDSALEVIRGWGLEDELDPVQEHIPYPTTYIIDKGGRVHWRRLGQRPDDRPTPGEIMAALPKG